MNDLLNKVVGQDGVKFSISVEWDTIAVGGQDGV